jgi:general secretion pathway protein D
MTSHALAAAVALPLLAAAPALAYAQDKPALVEKGSATSPQSLGTDGLRDDARTRAYADEVRAKRDADKERGNKPALKVAQAEGPTPGKPKSCRRPRGRFQFNADKEDIHSLLKRISQITCKNFIVSESVKGKSDITIISHRPVTSYQAEAAFLAALEANNMALVPAGAYSKVVTRKDAAKAALPMYDKAADLPDNDAQVTYLYELKFASKEQVQPLLRNLMSKSGDLQVIGGNLMIITDAGSNIHRLIKIVEKVDVSGSSSRMHVVDIQWADAQQIATKLQDIFKDATPKGRKSPAARPRSARKTAGAETPAPSPAASAEGAATPGAEAIEDVTIDKIIADERTNKLIIIGSLRAFQSVKEVIDLLDVPGGDRSTGSRVYVHPLNNADAQKAASTLSSLAQGAAKRGAKAKKGKKNAGAESAELFEGELKITADESTNSLVIIASPRDYKALKQVISELDQRRPQVFVEAAILEVALNENRQVGLDAYSGFGAPVPGLEGNGLGIIANEGGKNLVVSSAQALAARELLNNVNTNVLDPSQIATAVEASTALDSLIGVLAFQGPSVPGSAEAFGFPVPSFGVVLNALQTNANVNVLSTPHIMTTDNEKAEISVGERIPVVRGIAPVGGAGGALGGFGGLQQVAYEDVKLKFTVTPHVNDSGEMRIEIEQEVSDLGGNVPVGNGLSQPIITNRTAKTVVVVRDQQSVVLGGLISDRENDSESKIPILGDIPLFGWLFKNWSDSKSKTNLILVLTPYVIRDESDFKKIYDRKMAERREFIETYYGVAQEYNPYIDYDKKTGPVGKLVGAVDMELMKAENGGPGLPGEVVITPEAEISLIPQGEEGEEPTGDAPPAPDAEPAPAPSPEGDAGGDEPPPAEDGAGTEG